MSEEKEQDAELLHELFVDELIEKPETKEMSSSMTREELDARIELIEARADARLSRFEERVEQAVGELRRDRADIRQDIKSLKLMVIITVISAVILIVVGVAAFNATILSNMITSFESGKNTGAAVSQVADRMDKLQEKLIDLDKKLSAPPAIPLPEKN